MSEKVSKESQYSFNPLHPPRRGSGVTSIVSRPPWGVTKTFRDKDNATSLKQKYFHCKIVFVTILIIWQQNNYVANYHISCSVGYNNPS